MANRISGESLDGDAETPESFGKTSRGITNRWKTELTLAKKEFEEYSRRCSKIIARYRDEEDYSYGRYGKRLNILWSNVQTLQPAIYSSTPKPQVERRYKDKDPRGRLGSKILERALCFLFQPETVDEQFRAARDDYLLCGRGQVWIRYVPNYETPKIRLSPDRFSGIPSEADVLEDDDGHYYNGEPEKAYEEVVVEKVNRLDFIHSPARCWEEVRWVARRHYYRRDEIDEHFGPDSEMGLLEADDVKQIPLAFTSESAKKETEEAASVEQEAFQKAEVWEVWDKESRCVYWVVQGFDKLLKKQKDPLGLMGFFPCPRPLFSTLTSGTLVPVPDFMLYQDQAWEIDELTTRINLLVKSIRVAGVYDEDVVGLQRLVTESAENELIPVSGWNTFVERGGLKGAVDFLPIQVAAQVTEILYRTREQTKQEIYEITGISDVIRGVTTHPRETAAAQQTKAQFASTRLQERQSRMQMFVREAVAIAGEIVAEHFDTETLYAMSGAALFEEADSPDEFQSDFDAAVEMLRQDAMRSFRVDIETDSTIAINRSLEKQARIEAVTGIGRFIRDSKQLSDMHPTLMPFATQLLMFATRSFKAGRDLEASLEDAMAAIQKDLEQKSQQPPPPPPEVQKMQAEIQLIQQKAQAEIQVMQQKMQAQVQQKQQEMQSKSQQAALEAERKERELSAKIALDREELAAEIENKRREIMAEIELERTKLRQELIIAVAKHNNEVAKPIGENGELPPAEASPTRRVARFTTDENGDRVAIIEEISQ